MHSDYERVARLYHSMLRIRRVEEYIAEVYHSDVIKSPVHLSIGQEAVAVGICDPLNHDDFVSNTYRCHATYLAKGGDLKQMMAELYGKKGGCAGGKAGSMHLIDIAHGVLGASAVVGTTVPVACGYALAMQREAEKTGKQRIVVAVIGDGGTEEGCFSESLNFAALHQLPIIFICENNRLAIFTRLEKRWATEKLCERVATYGIPTHKLEDGDIFKLCDTMDAEIQNVRAGNGPAFIECATYRYLEHVGPRDDHEDSYRDRNELLLWQSRDQIPRLAAMLPDAMQKQIVHDIENELQEAIQFAENSPVPSVEDLYSHVYAE